MAQLLPLLSPGDVVIDGGNSFFSDTERRVTELREKGILFVGMGVSGTYARVCAHVRDCVRCGCAGYMCGVRLLCPCTSHLYGGWMDGYTVCCEFGHA